MQETLKQKISKIVNENGGGVNILFIMSELCLEPQFDRQEAPTIIKILLEEISQIPELGIQRYGMPLYDTPRECFFVYCKIQ